MKKLSVMLVAIAFLATSCGDKIEEYRGQIDELAGNWSETTTMVTELAGQVQGEQAKAQTMLGEMQIPEGFALSEENLGKAKELQGVVTEKIGGLTGMAQAIGAFVTDWQSKGAQVEALTSGLAEGSVPTDVVTQISGLKETIGGARTQLDEWKTTYQETTAGYTEAYQGFMALLPEDDSSDK